SKRGGMALNPVPFKEPPHAPPADFGGVALVCNLGPQMLSVNADLPVSTVGELIAYAKSNRGKLSIAFDNTAGAAAFGAKLFNKRPISDWSKCRIVRRRRRRRMSPVASIK